MKKILTMLFALLFAFTMQAQNIKLTLNNGQTVSEHQRKETFLSEKPLLGVAFPTNATHRQGNATPFPKLFWYICSMIAKQEPCQTARSAYLFIMQTSHLYFYECSSS